MKATIAAIAALASTAFAAPAEQKRQASGSACASAVTLTGNPFTGRTLHPNAYYRAEVESAAAAMTDSSLAAAAKKVADIGTFSWVDTISAQARAKEVVKDVPCNHILGLVIYDLPGRDCAAKASNGELPVGSLSRYKTEYIDPIVELIKANANTAFALVIEPDSLPNLVTNINLTTCQQSASGYRDGVAYALKQLNLPNVMMYMDAGHGGWLGWNDNLKPGAEELAKVYKAAGSPKQFRGISTNVAGYNSFDLSPGEFSKFSDAQWNKAQNEKTYVSLFGAALKTAGMPSQAIVDTGRSGVTGLRKEWGNWCNIKGAGFGPRPTSSTGDSNVDAFVWIKPGGESDGTSDTTANRYDSFCGKEESFKPSPEAGTWNQAYFEDLVKNAKPAL